MSVGKIYQSLSGFYDIECQGHLYRTRARGNFRKKRIKPVVGDQVEFTKEGYLLGVNPRHNRLMRPPLANVDQAIVVTSVQEPRFSAGLLNRQLVALAIHDIQPVIYFSKLDLLDLAKQKHYLQVAKNYRQIGYPVIVPQRFPDSDSLRAVKARLPKRETVVMGQTGVGKSTLLNHLVPGLHLKVGTISASLHRGRHTTRRVHLLTINHGLIADTPGFSSYDDLPVDIYHLKNYFPEFVRASNGCRFRECLHVNEPSCEVKKQVKNGQIMKSRYQTYLHLYQEIKNRKPIYKRKH